MVAPCLKVYLKQSIKLGISVHGEIIMNKIVASFGFVVGIAALLLQFSVSIPNSIEDGRSLTMSVIRYFSFFTILTNITIVLIYAASLFPRISWLRILQTPIARATGASCIMLVGLFYYFILAGLWKPEGLWLIADVTLHYITPITYVVWFSLFHRSGSLKFKHIPLMLLPAVIYLIYVMIRGAIIGEYPYPTFEIFNIGLTQVLLNIGALVVFLSALSAVAIVISRIAPGNKSPN